jgi:hypothetical protein
VLIEGRAGCAACGNDAAMHRGRPWGFAAAVLLTGGAASLALARAEAKKGDEPSWFFYGLAMVLVLAISGFIVARKRKGLETEPRQSGSMIEVEEPAQGGGPYRAMTRRRFIPRTPPLSGRLTALALMLCFAFTALAAPFAMHLPKWVEAEIVLSAWWIVWAISLGVILYRGTRVSDDHRFAPSVSLSDFGGGRGARRSSSRTSSSSSSAGWFDGLSGIGDLGDAGEGCLYVIGAILLAGAALLVAWLLVELIIPTVFTLAYLLLIRALQVVTNDRHGCKGIPSRAAGYGALWATIYIVPLAVVVLIVHAIARKHGF